MKTFDEMYPDDSAVEGDDYFWSPSSYQPILNAIGEIVVQVDEGNYQGDSWVLYRRGEEFGYLQFGWGSCSGCDALQACKNKEEVESLGRSLESDVESDVMWLDRPEMLKFFRTHDWDGDYGAEERKNFIRKVIETLEEFP